MPLGLQDASRSRIADIEMTRLDRRNEVFVRWLDRTARISAGEEPLVRRHEAVLATVTKEDRGAFGCDIADSLDLLAVLVCAAGYSLVASRVLDVLGYAQANPEVGRTVLQ